MKFREYLLREMADSRGDAIEEIGYKKEQIHLHFIKILRYEWNERDSQTHINEMGASWINPYANIKIKKNKRLKLRDYQEALRITRGEYDSYIKKYFTNDYLEYIPRFNNEDEAFEFVFDAVEAIILAMADGTIRNDDRYFHKKMKSIAKK